MSINELFETTSKDQHVGARELNGTAALTNIATQGATVALKRMEANIDVYRPRIELSAKDNNELDKLLEDLAPLIDVDENDPLNFLDDSTVESMLKSQQSKRSRTRSKTMTMDNYKTLLTAAIAENFLRDAYNKPKQAGGFKKQAGMVDFTPADLERFADDPVSLKKEIRNIQSKKSIMKSKADFDAGSEAWMQLLKVEAMLKDLRDSSSTKVVEVDTTRDALRELLADVDVEHIKAADSKELLGRIIEFLE